MSETNSHTDNKKSQVDRGDELADRREEGRRRARVLAAVGAFMAKRRRK